MTPLLLLLALAVAAPVPKNKEDDEFRKKTNAAREKAVKFLKEKQRPDGTWETINSALGDMEGGHTALVALAMLEVGVPANDPALAKAVEHLAKLEPKRTYVASLQTQVLARADGKKYAKEIQANADWLLKHAIMKNGKLDGWSYPTNAISDNSNTHFAVMGLHAAAQAGAKVDPEIWQKIRDYYADTQQSDGGWVYHNAGGDRKTTRSMTTAALLGLTVAVRYDKTAKGPDRAFEKGMAALLGGKLSDGHSAGYEWLTTAELGRALGTTEFKSGKLTRAWYREGAEKLVKEQREDGSWKAGDTGIDASQPVLTTAYGLFFLGPPPK